MLNFGRVSKFWWCSVEYLFIYLLVLLLGQVRILSCLDVFVVFADGSRNPSNNHLLYEFMKPYETWDIIHINWLAALPTSVGTHPPEVL